MGQRANYVIIRNGEATAYHDQWGAMGCIYQFAEGPERAAALASAVQPTIELLDWAFAEGGYLIDFDEMKAMAFGYPMPVDFEDLGDLGDFQETVAESLAKASELEDALSRGPLEFLRAIAPQWEGWQLEWDDRGVDAFAAHLERRGIHSIKTQRPGDPANRELFTLQA